MKDFDIYKAGGIVIKNRKLLIERSKGKEYFIAPGGSLEKGEIPKQALVRELWEEFKVKVKKIDLKEYGTFYAKAAGNEEKTVRMDVFEVLDWEGEPSPNSEVEEILWFNSALEGSIKIGSIFEHEVIPRLLRDKIID